MNELHQSNSQLIEINNNSSWKKRKNGSQVSVSSASSYQSDSSEDNLATLERKASLQDIIEKTEDKHLLLEYKRKCRSMSDGEATKIENEVDDPSFEVFPSLPNSVLEKMGLYGNITKERLSEEELEQKFTSLTLAFAIDAATVKERCERQRRHRDQTEINLSKEMDKFKEKLALMQPLCTDIEKAELLSTLLTQIEIIMRATSLVSIAAERYGSVQHEDRLGESVNLMVNHVQMLKLQRDSVRRQLQYTKRVLQQSPDSPSTSPTNAPKYSVLTNSNNKKFICKRRASIATFSQQLPDNKPALEVKRVTRRTSDLTLRASSLTRSSRPTRLEFGGDLLKISEGYVEELPTENTHESESENDQSSLENELKQSSPADAQPYIDYSKLNFREKIKYKSMEVKSNVENKYQKWTQDGTIHEICCFCALLCFSIGLLTMVNILIEFEYAKRGIKSVPYIWSWSGGHNRKT